MPVFREEIANLKRSWIHHTGMQFTTLLVLVASFSIISFVLVFMLNLDSVLSNWGDSVRVTAYIKDDLPTDRIDNLKKSIVALSETASVQFIDKAMATREFKQQMATYAPSLLNDTEFSNPFPASFVVTLRSGLRDQGDVTRLENFATKIRAMDGVEDISYGQGWIKNFSQLVEGISRSAWVLIAVLFAGSLLVISNSIRVSISSRLEEIEILELVGATSNMIRSPFIFEAAIMGFLAMALALGTNYALYLWGSGFLRENLSFARLSDQINFIKPVVLVGLILCGPAWGALSAFFTIRKLNTGWSAAEGKFE